MNAQSNATDTLIGFINSTSLPSDAVESTQEAAQEYDLLVPDRMTGDFLATLGEIYGSQRNVIVVSPAAGVISLEIAGKDLDRHHYTCITPEVVHQNLSTEAFKTAEIPSKNFRLIPGNIDILERLAPHDYGLIVIDVELNQIIPAIDAALPLLVQGGTLAIMDSLLDGTIGDSERNDAQTTAARQADEYIRSLGLKSSRLPLGSGMTLITT